MSDVAAAANVSLSTASRALQGSPLISYRTRLLIESTAEDLGYRPNRMASALRSKKSHLIGLVLSNLKNVSFHTIAEVVQYKLSHEGYQLIVGTTGADAQIEKDLLQAFADHGVDGVVVIGSGQNAGITNGLLRDGVAVVNVIRSSKDSAAPTVLAGDRDGSFAATENLILQGHHRIGFIGGLASTDSGRERLDGYVAALRSHGLAQDDALIVQGPFTQEFGGHALALLLKQSPDMTALFAANHEAVFGVLPMLVFRQIRIPEDLSLICYEDMPLLQMWHPPITVVDNGPTQMAELAVDLLMNQISDKSKSPQKHINRIYQVGARLIDRKSCAPVTAADSPREGTACVPH